eukprot:3504734-Pleurochrysis_carterae.AAC.1
MQHLCQVCHSSQSPVRWEARIADCVRFTARLSHVHLLISMYSVMTEGKAKPLRAKLYLNVFNFLLVPRYNLNLVYADFYADATIHRSSCRRM